MTRSRRIVVLLAALMLAVSACGAKTTVTVDQAAIAELDAAPVAAESDAPSGPDLGLLEQGSLEGKDVAIFFWADW